MTRPRQPRYTSRAERLPETAATAMLLGVALPRLALEPRHPHEYLIKRVASFCATQRAHHDTAAAAALHIAGTAGHKSRRVRPHCHAGSKRLKDQVFVAAQDGVSAHRALEHASMIGMVLVTHGLLATEFKAALEHVVGRSYMTKRGSTACRRTCP
jgi:hypothetical protein